MRLELLPDLLARGQRGLGLVAQFLAHTASIRAGGICYTEA
jgi:hypothetical protein